MIYLLFGSRKYILKIEQLFMFDFAIFEALEEMEKLEVVPILPIRIQNCRTNFLEKVCNDASL